jgi:tripartite motif-containing protein 71
MKPSRNPLRLGIAWCLVVGLTSSLIIGAAGPASATTASFSGSIDANGTNWRAHTFEVTSPGHITAILDWADPVANLNMFLYNAAGTLVASTIGTAKPERIDHDATTTGTWKVGVKAKTGATTYDLQVDFPGFSSVVTPRYVATLGGGTAGHADMYPSGLDVDGSGNVYVADTGDDQIQKFSPSGALLWVKGTRGPKAPGRFENPRDTAFQAGKVYVADTGFSRVQVLDATDGSVSAVWGTTFNSIMGISAGVDGSGNPVILVAESGHHTIRVYSPSGTLIRSVGSGPGNGPGQLNGVRDAATDADGTIYAADFANSRVVVFSPTGTPLDTWGVSGSGPQNLTRPYGVDLDPAGNVYVADSNNYIHKFTQSGGFLAAYGSPGDGAGQFRMLRRVALGPGPSPDVLGADLWTFKIEIFNQAGASIGRLGGNGPDNGFFNEPYGLAVDQQHLFVVDMVNQRVQRFSSGAPYGFQLTWGSRGWGEGNPGFNWARDATIGSNGGSKSLWVADTKNNRFTEFWPDGTPTGRSFGSLGSGVGQFDWPFAVTAIGSDIVVADTRNNRVQRWNPAGPGLDWTTGSVGGVSINAPKDVAVSAGDVYVVDTLNRRVVVLSGTTGAFVRQFGGSNMHQAEGIAIEPNGDVWVADTSWNRLLEFSPSGSLLQVYGALGSGNTTFNKPAHLEILETSTDVFLFVVDSWNDRVQVYDIG